MSDSGRGRSAARLGDMVKGWFVGDFSPTVLATQAAEVAIKRYKAGECEDRHHHKVATEITVVVEGRVRMNGVEYAAGDIVRIEPGESTDFVVLEDTLTVVVKVPGAKNDKYAGDA